jgi:aminopeptidase-like protein
MPDSPWTVDDGAARKRDMMALARRLFPIHRTLINDGYDRSLGIVGETLPLEVLQYPSGGQVWDWVIPDAWDVREAYVEDSHGRRVVDFAHSNLHLSAYSLPFSGTVSRDELLRHVKSLPDRPDAIPYNYVYYRRDWQFNMAHRDVLRLTDERYRAHIDVFERPGALKIGSCCLPGTLGREIIFSTYLCHPSLANDNLSGVVVAAELFKVLSRLPSRRYTYRLVILPETIGAITYLANHEADIPKTDGAFVVYDCGDPGAIHYKRSYFQASLVDRVASHVLRHYATGAVMLDWHPSGSDERQYNAPGVRIPAGSFMRSPPGEYLQYHTSLDTLEVLSEDALLDSVQTLYRFVQVLEADVALASCCRGEPCFSRHNMDYPSFHDDHGQEARYIAKHLLYEFDGTRSLLEIADRLGLPMYQVAQVAGKFQEAGLVRPI